jgi:hypothetical protein
MGDRLTFTAQSKENGKIRFIWVILLVTLLISIPSYPTPGFPAAELEDLDQFRGAFQCCQGHSEAVLVSLNNIQVTQDAFSTFLPLITKSPIQPPAGVWDTSNWDNSSWGN